jgi:hypothetical protein
MKQVCVTTVMGKRLIGKGMAQHPEIKRVLAKGTLVIIAGTTNGYVAEEILAALKQAEGFSRLGFRRGMTVAPGAKSLEAELGGDVVICDGVVCDGVWQKGKTIFDVVEDLVAGDVILKGANAFDARRQAAVQVAHPQGGTIASALTAVLGRRAQLIVPVGLEKRVLEDVNVLAQRCLALDAQGPRLLPIPGEIFTEIDAIKLLTGAEACLIAAGGVYGAEGASWLGLSGSEAQIQAAVELVESVANEPPCRV